MKSAAIIAILVVTYMLSTSATCNKNSDISLKIRESETRRIGGVNYTLTINEILDNRCPKNAECIRAGEAFVNISFKAENSEEQLLQFCTGIDCRRSTIGEADTITTSSGNIEIRLLAVDPYPCQSALQSSKTAKFLVRKL